MKKLCGSSAIPLRSTCGIGNSCLLVPTNPHTTACKRGIRNTTKSMRIFKRHCNDIYAFRLYCQKLIRCKVTQVFYNTFTLISSCTAAVTTLDAVKMLESS